MMNPEYKEAWVDKLISGDYKQGRLQLRCADNYCCLGVLAEVMGYEWLPGPMDTFRISGETWGSFECPVYGSFNKRMGEKAGLTDEEQNHLMTMNDDSRKSFVEIADWVKENL
jgi:hypothetical protein